MFSPIIFLSVLKSNAYRPAANYLQLARDLLPKDHWHQNYSLSLEIFNESVEAYYLLGEHEKAEALIAKIHENAQEVLDKLRSYELKIQFDNARNQIQTALASSLELLELLGLRLPKRPKLIHIISNLIKLKTTIGRKSLVDIISVEEATDPKDIAIVRIAMFAASSAYMASPNHLPVLVFNAARHAIRFGHSAYTPYAFALFGLIQLAKLEDIQAGYNYGKMAMRLWEKLQTQETKQRATAIFHFFIRHWKEPVAVTFAPLEQIAYASLEVGSTESFGYAKAHRYMNQIFAGLELKDMALEYLNIQPALHEYRLVSMHQVFDVWGQFVENLQGRSENAAILNGSLFNKQKDLVKIKADKNLMCLGFYGIAQCTLAYLFSNFGLAIEVSDVVENNIDNLPGMYVIGDYYFFHSLILIKQLELTNAKRKSYKFKKLLRRNIGKLKSYSEACPENRQHLYYLVQAEFCRIRNKPAQRLYEQATFLANKHNMLMAECICLELYGRYLVTHNKNSSFEVLSQALQKYERWGATAKVSQLKAEFKALRQEEAKVSLTKNLPGEAIDISRTTSSSGAELDLQSVVRASQTISQDKYLDSIIKNLMEITMENAGAQKGALFLISSANKISLQAEGEINTIIHSQQNKPLESCGNIVPLTVIHYVRRTGENVAITNAHKEIRFSKDNYLQKNKPASILCQCIAHRGKTIGILYLENKASNEVFTAQRIAVSEILAAQAAISIENVQLATEEAHRQRLQKELSDAKLESNKAQMQKLKKVMQPHFLLNSLNAIINSIQKQPEKAEEMVLALSEEFRGILEISTFDRITLEQELEICKTHIKIMAMRRDKEYTLSSQNITGNEMIPPMIFHTLVENAISHELSSGKRIDFIVKKISSGSKTVQYQLDCLGSFKIKKNTAPRLGTTFITKVLEETYKHHSFDQHPIEGGWRVQISLHED